MWPDAVFNILDSLYISSAQWSRPVKRDPDRDTDPRELPSRHG